MSDVEMPEELDIDREDLSLSNEIVESDEDNREAIVCCDGRAVVEFAYEQLLDIYLQKNCSASAVSSWIYDELKQFDLSTEKKDEINTKTSASRVIYYNSPNSEKSVEANKNSITSVERGMLLAGQRNPCRRGYMHDHRNRCRRVV
ncbi:hypothetical protein ACLKA7_001395 [Drosophila subpalustris]